MEGYKYCPVCAEKGQFGHAAADALALRSASLMQTIECVTTTEREEH